MKKLLTALILTILTVAYFTSCSCNQIPPQPYEYIQGPGGQQMVACYDNSGTRFLMDYLLFTSIMNSGGYGGVMNYYHTYPSRVTVYNSSYSSWGHFNGRSYGSSSWSSTYRPSSSSSTYRSTNGNSSSGSTYRPSTSTYKSPSSSGSSSSGASWRSGGSSSKPSSSGSSWRSSSGGSSYRPSGSSSWSRRK